VKGKQRPVTIYELIAVGPPPPEWVEALADYRKAMDLYRRRDFRASAIAFGRVLERRPGDQPSLIYVERCRKLEATPPPQEWDGVFDLLTK